MKKIIMLAAMLVMAISAVSYAAPIEGHYVTKNLFKDTTGAYHYVPSEEAKTIMKAEDMYKDDLWLVPCHVVMNMTEEEYEEFMRQGNGGDVESGEE